MNIDQFTDSERTRVQSDDCMRFVQCLAATHGHDPLSAADLFLARHPRSLNAAIVQKGSVYPGTVVDATWAAPVSALKPLFDAFIELSRAQEIISKLDGIQRVPMNTITAGQTAGGTYQWVGEDAPKPVSFCQFQSVSLGPATVAGIIAVSNELAKLSNLEGVRRLKAELVKGSAAMIDLAFVDPSAVAVPGTSPGSITSTAASTPSSGPSTANVVADLTALLADFATTNPDAEKVALLMTPLAAVAIAIATGSQTLLATGGSVFGVKVITSAAVGPQLVALDPTQIVLADRGAELSVSKQADLEMSTTPTSPPTASTVRVSLWQQNLIGVRVSRSINWALGRTSAVRRITGVSYA
jgi:hypothetical protein